jgi:hypothetical protein
MLITLKILQKQTPIIPLLVHLSLQLSCTLTTCTSTRDMLEGFLDFYDVISSIETLKTWVFFTCPNLTHFFMS